MVSWFISGETTQILLFLIFPFSKALRSEISMPSPAKDGQFAHFRRDNRKFVVVVVVVVSPPFLFPTLPHCAGGATEKSPLISAPKLLLQMIAMIWWGWWGWCEQWNQFAGLSIVWVTQDLAQCWRPANQKEQKLLLGVYTFGPLDSTTVAYNER